MDAEEITKVIYEDLQDALSVIAEDIENPSAAIESINVRVGERSSFIQTIDDLDPSPFSSENGWIIDVKFSEFELKKSKGQTFKTVSVFPLFSGLPINKIKGIGPTWAERFKKEGINTIGDLFHAGDAQLEEIGRQHNSINPFAYRSTAVQLDRKIPLDLIAQYGDIDIYSLLKNEVSNILNSFPDLEMSKIISDFFDCCANSIDAHALGAIRMDMLEAG